MKRNTDISPEEFEELDRYILKEMPQEEYDAFTLKWQSDPVLQNKMHTVRLLLMGIQESNLEENMDRFHEEMASSIKNKPASSGKIFSLRGWMIAASVIVLAGLGALWMLNKPTSQEKLFATYYKPDPGLITAMGTTENYLFERAMIDYKTKKYDSALKSWQELLQANPDNDTLNYFVGSALLAKENAGEAIPFFKKVTGQSNSYFFKEANWYLGLALIKQQNSLEAIPYLEKSDHQNREAVLKKLKE